MQRTVANGSRSYIAPCLGPRRRLFGTATPPWRPAQQGNPWLPSISCRAAHAHQHSHLEEAIMDMQQLQQRPNAPLPTRLPVRTQHIFRDASQLAPSSTVTTTSKAPMLHQSFIPHLDGFQADAVEVLEFLRDELLTSQARTAAVVTAEESGAALLDLISVLVLLDEDVRLEEPGAVVLFQPVLDMRNKIHSNANLRHHLHTHYTGNNANGHSNGHNGHGNSHHSHAKGHGSHSHGHSSRHNNGHDSSHDTSHALNASDLAPAVPIAALVSKARCPKLLMEYPSTCIVATLRMDSADIAGVIADAVADHGSTRLRVANSAEGLVAAWRAIRRARAVVKARSSGAQDVVCTAQVESFVSTPAPATNASRPHSASGDMSATATASSPAQQTHQHGIMYFNIWRIR